MVLLNIMICCWRHIVVYPFVCLSVTLCIVALRVDVDDYKLYRHILSKHLPIHFFRHLLYRSATEYTEKKTNRLQFGGVDMRWTKLPERHHGDACVNSAVRFCNLQLYIPYTSYAGATICRRRLRRLVARQCRLATFCR